MVQLRNTRASLLRWYWPCQTCAYLSGSRRRSYSISLRSSSGNHGLSDQLVSTTIASGGGSVPRKSTSIGSVAKFGFKLNHNSKLPDGWSDAEDREISGSILELPQPKRRRRLPA